MSDQSKDELVPRIVYRRPQQPHEPAPVIRSEARAGRGGEWLWALFAVDLALAIVSAFVLRFLLEARAWELDKSYDISDELAAALSGFGVLIPAAAVLVAGFLVSAGGILIRRRVGWTLSMTWAVLLTLTIAGAPYGVPALIILARPANRMRFQSRL